MNKALLLVGMVVLVVAGVFYSMTKTSSRPSHIHFMAPAGFLTEVIYFSEKLPETAEHQCDGRFSKIPDHSYLEQLQLWEAEYAGQLPK